MRRALIALAFAVSACGGPAPPPPTTNASYPQRVVSLDYCADQFVLELADRDQIAALSPHARDDYSYMRARALGLPRARPDTEIILGLAPDLVVRSYGGAPGLEDVLQRVGVATAQLQFANEFDGIRANIKAMAEVLGHPERGAALIAQMDQRLAAIPAPIGETNVLYVTPGGVTTGSGTLVHEMFSAAGLKNFETRSGWPSLPLERLAYVAPDLIAAGFFGSSQSAVDAWSPARHPVAARRLQAANAIAIDGAWTACGGWFVVDAVEALARARVEREGTPP